MGVVGISNEITLRVRPVAANVSRKIEEALMRQAVREARHIQVSVEGCARGPAPPARSCLEKRQ